MFPWFPYKVLRPNWVRQNFPRRIVSDYRRIISRRKSGHVPWCGARLCRVKATTFCQPIDGTRNGGRVPYIRVHTHAWRLLARTFTVLRALHVDLTCLPWHTFLAPFDINGMKEVLTNKGQRSSISIRISWAYASSQNILHWLIICVCVGVYLGDETRSTKAFADSGMVLFNQCFNIRWVLACLFAIKTRLVIEIRSVIGGISTNNTC